MSKTLKDLKKSKFNRGDFDMTSKLRKAEKHKQKCEVEHKYKLKYEEETNEED